MAGVAGLAVVRVGGPVWCLLAILGGSLRAG
jgi:hypothetical protein